MMIPPNIPIILPPTPKCPTCGSPDTELLTVGATLGMLAAGAAGAVLLALTRLPRLATPIGLATLLAGTALWAKNGKAVGAELDRVILRKHQCRACGHRFED